MSPQHCIIGTIEYPACGGLKEEYGYLLYCKSSLTGDEPAHLYEYRSKHPDFPHETTADQWFNEKQFEAYRELGYHIGKNTFSPVLHKIRKDKTPEPAFNELKEFWQPRSPLNQTSFSHHSEELNRIFEAIQNDSQLHFMDIQIYPEWMSLMEGTSKEADAAEFHENAAKYEAMWLPSKIEERRSGFYICNRMIQLMENVYLDLDLETFHDHPDNRGWMNLFTHWAWAGMFRTTWAVSACTFGSKFQKFCEKYLRLSAGEVSVELLASGHFNEMLENGGNNVFTTTLNSVEQRIAKEIITHYPPAWRRLYGFFLSVNNPVDNGRLLRFCFGFAFAREKERQGVIEYFRVQDHLRRMGLGRQAMEGLILLIEDWTSRIEANGSQQVRPSVLSPIICSIDSEISDRFPHEFRDETLRKMASSVLTEMRSQLSER